jgi:hypothetical protein
MVNEVLPGQRHDFLSESQELGEVLLALGVDEVVEILPVEDQLDEATVLEGTQEGADMNVGHVGSLVGLGSEVLVEDDDAFLKQVSVDGLLLGFLDLHHCDNIEIIFN